MTDLVESMIKKAAEANTAIDALQYSQAALNAANALCSLGTARVSGQKP